MIAMNRRAFRCRSISRIFDDDHGRDRNGLAAGQRDGGGLDGGHGDVRGIETDGGVAMEASASRGGSGARSEVTVRAGERPR